MARISKLNSIIELKEFFKKGLENKVFDGILGLFYMPSKDALTLEITSDSKEIDNFEPLAPVMPVQAARVISNIKFTESKENIVCFIKPCELRASIELIKLKQIMPEGLIFISYDCGGAINVSDFKESIINSKNPVDELKDQYKKFEDFTVTEKKARFACTICDKFIPTLCDIRVRAFGEPTVLEAVTEKGLELLKTLGFSIEESDLVDYDNKIAAIGEKRKEKRDKERKLFKEEVKSLESLTKELSTCIRCHNCMINCPLDYCKECIFRTPVFDHPVENYQLWLNRKGTVKLPTDTLLFHLTRLNHMSSSCVSCGCCESACPSGIKISRIFMFLGEEVQKIFDYVPGRSLEEELPVATFREKELEEI